MFTVISLGAGVQSSTLALMAAKGMFPQWKIRAAVFADTQAEPKLVYDWLEWLEKQLTFPVFRVTAGSLREDSLIMRKSEEHEYIYLRTLIPMFVKNEDGGKGRLIRKCTRDYKILCVQRKLKGMIGKERLNAWRLQDRRGVRQRPIIRQLIGISYDEIERVRSCPCRVCTWPKSKEMDKVHLPFAHNEYPLVNLKLTRQDCIDWMKENGYPKPPRSACTFCPYHSNEEWRNIKENSGNQPGNDWERVVAFERYMQRLQNIDQRLKGQIYLHPSLKPIDEIDFGSGEEEEDPGFGQECQGMCGS